MDFKAMLLPAVGIGVGTAVVFGVITSLPILGMFIGFGCCIWSTLAGFGAAYWYGRGRKMELQDGAIIGAMTGFSEGIVEPIVMFLIGQVFNLMGAGAALAGGGAKNAATGFAMGAVGGVVGVVIGIAISVVLYTLFGAIGGVIYTATLGKK